MKFLMLIIVPLIGYLGISLNPSFPSVHHADVHLHVGLAGCDSVHLFACLHVFQHLDHLPKHDRSGGSKFMS